MLSVVVRVEHYEEPQLNPANAFKLRLATGTLKAPTIVATTEPPKLSGAANEGVYTWDVTALVTNVNGMKVVIDNKASNTRKIFADRVWVTVSYVP